MLNRPFTVHSYANRKQKEKEQEEAKKNVGIFTTNESRKEVAKEIKKTHFVFGNNKDNSMPESLNKATYQNLNFDNKDASAQQKKMSLQNKRSNFIFGMDQPNTTETTSSQAYNSKNLRSMGNGINTFSVNTLRKGNFRLGFEAINSYETTAQSNYTNKNEDFVKSQLSKSKADRSSNIAKSLFGHNKPEYKTTNSSNFTQKDVTNSFKDKLLMKERDKNLKQANFSFGHFSGKPVTYSSQTEIEKHAKAFHEGMAKRSQLAKQSKLKGVMSSTGNGLSDNPKPESNQDTFKSMAQVLFDEKPVVGNETSQVSNKLMKDLRSTHFQFGNNDGKIESCSHKDHPKFAIDQKGLEESKQLAKKMQSTNFVMGDQRNKMSNETSSNIISGSKSFNNRNSTNTAQREHAYGDPRKTTIDIGKGKGVDYTSEAKEKFIPYEGRFSTIDKETKNNLAYLKQNHFELGSNKQEFSTVNRTDFSAKPNPGYKKSTMNMQTTSFKMGYQGNPFDSNTQSKPQSYTDRNAKFPYKRETGVKPGNIASKGNQMQKENFSLGKNGGEFRTMNQAYYRWIQPKGDH